MKKRARLQLYSLVGPATVFAVDEGLTSGDWFRSDVPRKRLKELMRRSDMPAVRDTMLWVGVALAAAVAGILLWGTWWAVPCFLVYGVLYDRRRIHGWQRPGTGRHSRRAGWTTACTTWRASA